MNERERERKREREKRKRDLVSADKTASLFLSPDL